MDRPKMTKAKIFPQLSFSLKGKLRVVSPPTEPAPRLLLLLPPPATLPGTPLPPPMSASLSRAGCEADILLSLTPPILLPFAVVVLLAALLAVLLLLF